MQSPEQQIEQVIADLISRYPRFPAVTVERRVRAGFERYARAPVQTYLPVLVQREVAEQFRDADRLAAGGTGEPEVA